jgi:hypothetical protein
MIEQIQPKIQKLPTRKHKAQTRRQPDIGSISGVRGAISRRSEYEVEGNAAGGRNGFVWRGVENWIELGSRFGWVLW